MREAKRLGLPQSKNGFVDRVKVRAWLGSVVYLLEIFLKARVLELTVRSVYPAVVEEGGKGIGCLVTEWRQRPLVVIWDRSDVFGGSTLESGIDVVLDWLEEQLEGIELSSAKVICRDRVGSWDVAKTEGFEWGGPRLTDLTWPGAEPRSEEAARGLIGKGFDSLMAEMGLEISHAE